MTERKVDVMDRSGKVLCTYAITIGALNPPPKDADYETAALSTARAAKLVPEADFTVFEGTHAQASASRRVIKAG